LAVISLGLVLRARSAPGTRVRLARGSLFLVTLLVSVTGHWGGVLVFGPEYYSSAWPWGPPESPPPQIPPTTHVSFVADIAPIIKESCFKCHGGEKSVKGGLNLSTKALMMKGGDSGAVIVLMKPLESSFYTLLLSKESEERMPKKAKRLPGDQIEKIRRWILDGAEWPETFDFRK
jgi:hypothetical protein